MNKHAKVFIKVIMGCFALLHFSGCSARQPANPTPDMAAMATQLWVEMAVQQTLTALAPTATPLPTATPTPLPIPVVYSTPIPVPADPFNHPPVYNPYNLMELVFIPAGEFKMGATIYDSDRDTNEEPQHKVYLDSFWISKTQVTNNMFNACVNNGVCSYSASHQTNPNFLDPNYAHHPVVYVSWDMAQTFCMWTGGRLPTEAEWEKAARGTEGVRYAWGEERPREKFTNVANFVGSTTPAGLYPFGASPYGVLDMGGNVREWVNDWYDENYFKVSPNINPLGPGEGEKKVLKGAAFSDSVRYARPSNRLAHEPKSPGAVRGFRCVYP